MPTPSQRLYEQIVDAAQRHGKDSEPEMEVGDLQAALRAALEQMTPVQLTTYREAILDELWDIE